MDVFQIPAVALFTGMMAAFAMVMILVTVGDAIKH